MHKTPEPGVIGDPTHGLPGPAEPLPEDDKTQDEPTQVNEDDDDDDA